MNPIKVDLQNNEQNLHFSKNGRYVLKSRVGPIWVTSITTPVLGANGESTTTCQSIRDGAIYSNVLVRGSTTYTVPTWGILHVMDGDGEVLVFEVF